MILGYFARVILKPAQPPGMSPRRRANSSEGSSIIRECGTIKADATIFPGRPLMRGARSIGNRRDGPRVVVPLDATRLEELALAYTARFATSAARLEAYLVRKLRQRGFASEGLDDAPTSEVARARGAEIAAALVARFVSAGYVDDESFAQARAGSLLRRGYGARRIVQALGQAGIGEAIRDEVLPGVTESRRAALAMARKRRFGPWGLEPPDPKHAEKQIAAMLRAGHAFASARLLIHARTIAEAEEWAEEPEDL